MISQEMGDGDCWVGVGALRYRGARGPAPCKGDNQAVAVS